MGLNIKKKSETKLVMITNWNQIEAQAKQFSKNWKSINRSGNNSLNFSIDFFKIYGISPDQVVGFEAIDFDTKEFGFLWKGVALFKTTNKKTLAKSFIQAKNHLYTLTQNEIPLCSSARRSVSVRHSSFTCCGR